MPIDKVVQGSQLYTNRKLSPDDSPQRGGLPRRWYVLKDVGIHQIIKSPLQKAFDERRYLVGDTVDTVMDWVFDESVAHKLDPNGFYETTTGYHPVFIETPGAPLVNGNEVVGFVVSGDCIALVGCNPQDATPVSFPTPEFCKWLQVEKPKPVSTNTSAKARLKVIPVQNSKKNGTYDVVVYTDKTVSCPCKAWINRRECRHIRDAQVVSFIQTL